MKQIQHTLFDISLQNTIRNVLILALLVTHLAQ